MSISVRIAALLVALCLVSSSTPVSASASRVLLQNYDDSVGAGSWKLDSGIEAECGGEGFPASNWGGQTQLRHFRSNGFIIVQIRIIINVLVRGFFGERFTADSTFTFRFTEDNYNSYANNGWLWSPSSAATIVKLSDGHGDYVTVQTSVTVNLQQWRIQIFEVLQIIANTCPSAGGCSGSNCGQSACSSSNCGSVDASGFSGSDSSSGGSSGGSNSGSGDSSGVSTDGGSSGGNSGGSSSSDDSSDVSMGSTNYG